MIFADSDAYIAIYLPQDPNNGKAEELSRKIEKEDLKIVTSWDVIDEVATKLSYALGKLVSKKFLEDRRKSDEEIYFIDRKSSSEAIKLFNKQTSKRVSLTDCSNMVIAKSLGVDAFFSFDRHYKKNGFKLLEDTTS